MEEDKIDLKLISDTLLNSEIEELSLKERTDLNSDLEKKDLELQVHFCMQFSDHSS